MDPISPSIVMILIIGVELKYPESKQHSEAERERGPFCDELDKIIRTRDAVFAESAWSLLRRGGAISNQPKRLVAQTQTLQTLRYIL